MGYSKFVNIEDLTGREMSGPPRGVGAPVARRDEHGAQPWSGDAPLSSSGARCALELLNSSRAAFRRGEQPQRGTSGGCSPSPASGCYVVVRVSGNH